MLALTRINGTPFHLNPDHLWLVEATPDTVLTMINGEHMMVRESCEAVVQAFIAHKQRIAHNPPLKQQSPPAPPTQG
jgi:flagellar protein FlbD